MSNTPTTLPVSTIADVLAILPSFLRPDDPAPVRDGILAGLLQLCLEIQDWAQYAAAQADALEATGTYEDAIGGERQVFREGAANTPYRAEIVAPPEPVSPTALLAAVNAILAPYTTIQAAYFEQPDQCFAFKDADAPVVGTSRAYAYKDTSVSQSPDYSDRLYQSEAAQNGGYFHPGHEPGAARVFQDTVGRYFIFRVPDLSSVDAQDTPVYQELQPNAFYVGTSAAGSWTSYELQNAITSATLYASIINTLQRLHGQSIRIGLIVDPKLI